MSATLNAPVGQVSRRISDEFIGNLQCWLNENLPGYADERIQQIQSPSGTGLSGETYIVTFEQKPGQKRTDHRVVLKRNVIDRATNPQSNFENLRIVQTLLGQADDFPVPKVLAYDHSGNVIGSQFLIMEFIEGSIPSDLPSYAESGWVRDSSPEQRYTMWQSGIDFLVKLHNFDYRQYSLDSIRFETSGEDDLERCLNYSIAMFRRESDEYSSDLCDQAVEYLVANRPKRQQTCISWGDARIGNMVWRDYECVGALDWEMSSLGCPGIDVGWWSFTQRWSTYGQNLPDLSGMCVGQDLANIYRLRGGSKIDDITYFEVLAVIRVMSIWLRMYKTLVSEGKMSPQVDPLGDSIHMIRVLRLLMSSVI